MKNYQILSVIASIFILSIFGASQQVEAATITISDQASCKAQGGIIKSDKCFFSGSLTIPQGDSWTSTMFLAVHDLTVEGELNAPNGMDADKLTNKGTITTVNLISIGPDNFWVNDCGGKINLLPNGIINFNAGGTNHGVIKGDSTTAITTPLSSITVVNSGIIQSSVTLNKVSIKDVSSPCPNEKKAVISESSTTQEQNENSQIKEIQNLSNRVDISVAAPLKQVTQGVLPNEIICKEGLELIIKNNGSPACVKSKTAEILIERGWAKQKQKQIELLKETEKREQEKFDPIVIKSAKESIPKMQSLPKEVLKQCKAIKSFSDYQIFLLAVEVMGEELIENMNRIGSALTLLELQGYDKHPEVGPLIRETRSLASATGTCIDGLVSKYGS